MVLSNTNKGIQNQEMINEIRRCAEFAEMSEFASSRVPIKHASSSRGGGGFIAHRALRQAYWFKPTAARPLLRLPCVHPQIQYKSD